MPVAQQLLSHFNEVEGHEKIEEITENPIHSFDYLKRETSNVLNIGSNNVPVVMADFCLKEKITPASFFCIWLQLLCTFR